MKTSARNVHPSKKVYKKNSNNSNYSNYSTLNSFPQTKPPSMTPLTCWRPVAATLSNQNGAGFGSLSAQDTLTDSTESLFCFFVFLGGMDIHYTSATIVTSRVCEVHHKPKRPRLTTHSELFQALILNVVAKKAKQATANPKPVT